MVKLNELKRIDETSREKHFFKEFNFSEVDITDIIDMLENAGYNYDAHGKQEFLPFVKFTGLANKEFMFQVGLMDDAHADDTKPYSITTIYVSFGRDGKLHAEYAGMPDKENMSEEEVKEYLKS